MRPQKAPGSFVLGQNIAWGLEYVGQISGCYKFFMGNLFALIVFQAIGLIGWLPNINFQSKMNLFGKKEETKPKLFQTKPTKR